MTYYRAYWQFQLFFKNVFRTFTIVYQEQYAKYYTNFQSMQPKVEAYFSARKATKLLFLMCFLPKKTTFMNTRYFLKFFCNYLTYMLEKIP
jgi:hypothetical protein